MQTFCAINFDFSISASMRKYTSYIIYRKEWALKWFIFIAITLGLAFMSSFALKSKLLTILFFALTFSSFLFFKVIMKYFTRKALINLDTDKISFYILKVKDDTEENFLNYSYSDIKSYNIQFPTSRFVWLILNLNSGSKKEFSFLRRPFNESQRETDKVIESIHVSFKHFNLEHETKKIEFEPSFFGSKKGLYTIGFLALLLIFGIGLAISLNKNVPLTFLGSALIIAQLFTRRMADLTFYKKMKAD